MPDDHPRLPPESYAPGSPPPSAPPAGDGIFAGAPPREPGVRPAETRPRPAHTPAGKQASANEVKDSFREVIETIVFVVVLVLLLKTFLAEAFVIPTGSMATTLLGYHREVVCEQCNYPFLVNAHAEVEPDALGRTQRARSCICPNCFFQNRIHAEMIGEEP